MYSLSNSELTVSILNPIADRARLGSRYCTGGYIWQVSDARKGELLAGPEYPKEPNTFDGQGAPDFFIGVLGAEACPLGGEVGVIGVGRVRRTSPILPFDVRHNREVIEFVQWDVVQSGKSITMRTRTAFQEWAYALERTLRLDGRQLTSTTAIRNLGQGMLPVRWFPHPFFPITADGALCRFSLPVSLAENPGYALNQEGFILRKPDHDWAKGWYQPVEFTPTHQPLVIEQKHDKVGLVTATFNYTPAFLPIWGNQRTFSFEPYYQREFKPGEGAAWSVTYRF